MTEAFSAVFHVYLRMLVEKVSMQDGFTEHIWVHRKFKVNLGTQGFLSIYLNCLPVGILKFGIIKNKLKKKWLLQFLHKFLLNSAQSPSA